MPVLAEVSFTILPIGDSSGRWPPSQRNRLGARPDFRHGRAIPNLLLLPSLFRKIKAFRWILVITYYFDFEIRSEAHLLEIKRDEFSSLEEIKGAAFFFLGKLKLGS